jgi:CRP-like cAMP-binding protein
MHALAQKLRNLATVHDEELRALVTMFSVKRSIRRGEDIITIGSSSTYSTVLLQGLACRYKIIENGRRQIFTFQYPGDFCDGHSYILPTQGNAVSALTACSVGIILHKDIERITAKFPNLGLALWRDTMIEASIFREWNVGQRPALERIAHLLCEQTVRLESIGIIGGAIPMTQVDLADAAGLSTVHVNRTIQDLRQLGVLMKNSRAIAVSHWDGLVEIAKFDGRYLNMPQVLSKWSCPVLPISQSTHETSGPTSARQKPTTANADQANNVPKIGTTYAKRSGSWHLLGVTLRPARQ